MKHNLTYQGYSGSVDISIEDNCLHGKIEFINDLVTFEGLTPIELKTAFEEAVDRYLAYCKKTGTVPDKPFSGSFNVRTGAALHRLSAQVAASKGVSLNEHVVTCLGLGNNTKAESQLSVVDTKSSDTASALKMVASHEASTN
jgi:predicted HicB family RNase H-like nuclease